MTDSFINPNFIFDFETANEMVVAMSEQSATGTILPISQAYLKSEQHSPMYHNHHQHHHHHLQQQHDDQHHKEYDTYFSDITGRDLNELEPQNNNNNYAWTHPGIVCPPPPDLRCMVDNLETSLSDQSGLNLSYENEEKFARGPLSVPTSKKGRGGRKKSVR